MATGDCDESIKAKSFEFKAVESIGAQNDARDERRRIRTSSGLCVGSAEEFLDQSEEETTYVDLKLTLGENLKKRRQRKDLTRVELAEMLKSSQARVAKMEAGDLSVS